MAETAQSGSASSGVTAESIKESLVSKLGAQHVEIEDLSGMANLFLSVSRFLLCCLIRSE